MRWNALVPELMVSDFDTSLRFYVDVLGFAVCYSRDDPLFAYLEREGAQLMLEQYRDDGWLTAPLHAPFGRGMNLQIECSDATTLRDRVVAAGGRMFLDLEDAWYAAGDVEVGQRQCIVVDPDGYLLRFAEDLGERSPAG
ncbi:MAG: VOC family protein [Planctomycetes bacterium]|nr:VOC family protein [Planctomycetota bacterium]